MKIAVLNWPFSRQIVIQLLSDFISPNLCSRIKILDVIEIDGQLSQRCQFSRYKLPKITLIVSQRHH